MKKGFQLIQYYGLGILGIIFISAAPTFFMTNGMIGLFTYIREVLELAIKLVQPSEWVYLEKGIEKPIFSYLWEPYTYSMTVLGTALGIGFLVAFILAGLTIFLPSFLRGLVKRLLHLFETVPDLLVAFMIQLLVVGIYKKYDILLFKFATMGDERVYIAPILTLAILPAISLYKVTLLLMEEEMTKHYVSFAQSKGIRYKSIIVFHVFRNTIQSLFYHSKMIVWTTLSSLLIIEYMYNMNGITSYIMEDFRPVVTAIILWMIFTPFFFVYQSLETYVTRKELKTVTVRFKGESFFSNWRQWPIWGLLWRGFIETLQHFKNIKFLLGFLVIFGMLGYSVYHSITAEVLVDKYEYIYDDNDQLISAPPHEPAYVFMGTDSLGFSIWDQIVAGAKYTILFALVIAFFRTIGGLVFAVPYAFLMKDRWQKTADKVVDSLHYLPLSVIALIILQPVLEQTMGGEFQYSLIDRIVLEILILTILSLPLLTTLIGNEIRLLLQKEFIFGARVLGGNKRHMLWRHLLPHLGSRLGIVFGQQFIQALIVFIHLGVFGLFVGGTITSNDPFFPDPPRSFSYEWSGLISSARTSLMTGQLWLILPVLVAFVVLIIAMQLVVEGIKDVQQSRVGVITVDRRSWLKRLKQMRKDKQQKGEQTVGDQSFDFLQKKSE